MAKKITKESGESLTALHKHENLIQEVEGGYLFYNDKDGVVRFRSTETHNEIVEANKFVEPPAPILNGRN